MSTEQRRVGCMEQSDGRQADIRCFCDRLVVSPGTSDHQESQLLEGCLDLLSEGSMSKVTSSRSGSRAAALQHSSLAGVPGHRH